MGNVLTGCLLLALLGGLFWLEWQLFPDWLPNWVRVCGIALACVVAARFLYIVVMRVPKSPPQSPRQPS